MSHYGIGPLCSLGLHTTIHSQSGCRHRHHSRSHRHHPSTLPSWLQSLLHRCSFQQPSHHKLEGGSKADLMYTRMHACTHAHRNTHARTHTHRNMHAHTHTQRNTHARTHTHRSTHTCTHSCTHTHTRTPTLIHSTSQQYIYVVHNQC